MNTHIAKHEQELIAIQTQYPKGELEDAGTNFLFQHFDIFGEAHRSLVFGNLVGSVKTLHNARQVLIYIPAPSKDAAQMAYVKALSLSSTEEDYRETTRVRDAVYGPTYGRFNSQEDIQEMLLLSALAAQPA